MRCKRSTENGESISPKKLYNEKYRDSVESLFIFCRGVGLVGSWGFLGDFRDPFFLLPILAYWGGVGSYCLLWLLLLGDPVVLYWGIPL